MDNCKDPACVDGYIHEDGETTACWRCGVATFLLEFIDGLDAAADAMPKSRKDFPNRASYRAAVSGRHARAAYLIEQHDGREALWSLVP